MFVTQSGLLFGVIACWNPQRFHPLVHSFPHAKSIFAEGGHFFATYKTTVVSWSVNVFRKVAFWVCQFSFCQVWCNSIIWKKKMCQRNLAVFCSTTLPCKLRLPTFWCSRDARGFWFGSLTTNPVQMIAKFISKWGRRVRPESQMKSGWITVVFAYLPAKVLIIYIILVGLVWSSIKTHGLVTSFESNLGVCHKLHGWAKHDWDLQLEMFVCVKVLCPQSMRFTQLQLLIINLYQLVAFNMSYGPSYLGHPIISKISFLYLYIYFLIHLLTHEKGAS